MKNTITQCKRANLKIKNFFHTVDNMCCFFEFLRDTNIVNKKMQLVVMHNTTIKSYGECSICLEDLNSNLYALQCGHLFHENCIQKWLKLKKYCPVCQFE